MPRSALAVSPGGKKVDWDAPGWHGLRVDNENEKKQARWLEEGNVSGDCLFGDNLDDWGAIPIPPQSGGALTMTKESIHSTGVGSRSSSA
jgi:hypothetical protein